MVEFNTGYKNFKIWHTHKLNILFHFITSLLQIYFGILFLITFNIGYILSIILIPYITDGIGHLIEKNFGIVLLINKVFGSTNSAGVNGWYNFLYRLMLFGEKFLKI